MSVFFNGRLLITPTSASRVDDSAMRNANLTVGNVLAVLGLSTKGTPKTPLRFGSPSEAKAALGSGDLLDAIVRAFDPSAQTGGPSTVIAIRVNPAVQSQLTLKDASAANAILLKSTDYGAVGNTIKVKVETGTNIGKKLTTQVGNDYYTGDDIARTLFSLQYTGAAASATMTLNGTTLTVEAPTGTQIATASLSTYNTVQKLVDYMSTIPGLTATVLNSNGSMGTLNQLDYATAQDIKTAAFSVTGNLQACIDWFNSAAEGYVDASRVDGAGAPPTNIAFTYLSGGSDGTASNTDWSDAFTALQQVDCQWVTPASSNAAIHAMADSHCAFMSTVGKMERRAICGMASGTTDAQAIAAALAINSDRTSLVHLGMYDYDDTGNLVLFQPYIMAAMIAGAFAGSDPGTPLTNKTLKIRGLERKLRNPTDTDPLITGGVLCVESTATGYKVVKSISTWLVNDNYNRVEVSTGAALDFVVRNVRDALDVLRGEKNSPLLLARAVSIADTTLQELARPEPQGPGVIVGDDANPPFKGITATIEGDVLRVEFQCSPAIPCNYVLTTVYAVPYTGTATA